MKPARVLVVEDEPSLLLALEDNLRLEGYEVLSAPRGDVGLELALNNPCDLVILDVMLPGMDGFSVCRALREQRPELPVLILSARDQVVDVVRGLELGVVDYVKKPVAMAELLARIKARLRSGHKEEGENTYRFGDIALDFRRMEARRGAESLSFTTREFQLLQYLVEHRGEVIGRDELLERVWGYDAYPSTRTVDNFVLRLRKALEADPSRPRWILSVRGVGYRFTG